jgi:hypothetical protein
VLSKNEYNMIEQTYDIQEYEYIDKKLDNGTVIKDV